ncbi:transcription factor FAMA-like isoform X2 [Tasmannia lanceolata]|uniref:transcription factor FAMA-like isoform X2 n=1 Tax=Tasmannia lanceolata TaxID=3420 RepID=UPI0040641441
MEREEENYSADLPSGFTGLDYSLDHHHHHQLLRPRNIGENSENGIGMVDYMLNNPPPTSADKLNFADVMQFSDYGPKLALNQPMISDEYTEIDPVYFLKFPVLSDKFQDPLMVPPPPADGRFNQTSIESRATIMEEGDDDGEEEEALVSEETSVRLHLLGSMNNSDTLTGKTRRKRPRSVKTNEEVESQRMTHIAVERNRRKQMNEHLRVLRSLMPGSYVQRGDQASIIGGAIEFVRELEQLLQCLESQKRRRLFGGEGTPRPIGDSPSLAIQPSQTPFFPSLPLPNDQIKLLEFEGGLQEETAEIKSCLADVEVKLLGFDAMIKILSRRRPGQLLKTIAALEDLQLNILHTNITTIEQTVLYSFNVKIAGEPRFTAEDIANSVQQIFNFIHLITCALLVCLFCSMDHCYFPTKVHGSIICGSRLICLVLIQWGTWL